MEHVAGVEHLTRLLIESRTLPVEFSQLGRAAASRWLSALYYEALRFGRPANTPTT